MGRAINTPPTVDEMVKKQPLWGRTWYFLRRVNMGFTAQDSCSLYAPKRKADIVPNTVTGNNKSLGLCSFCVLPAGFLILLD